MRVTGYILVSKLFLLKYPHVRRTGLIFLKKDLVLKGSYSGLFGLKCFYSFVI